MVRDGEWNVFFLLQNHFLSVLFSQNTHCIGRTVWLARVFGDQIITASTENGSGALGVAVCKNGYIARESLPVPICSVSVSPGEELCACCQMT